MTIGAFIRKLARKLRPPGNRAPLETEYRQPNAPAQGSPSNIDRTY